MKILAALAATATLLAGLGCARSVPERMMQTGPGGPVVMDSLQAIGGAEPYLEKRIETRAIIVTYENGRPHVGSAEMEIHLAARHLVATGPAGKGRWRATVTGSTCRVSTRDLPSQEAQRTALCEALLTVLERFGGPVNFINGQALSIGLSQASIEGVQLQRVSVAPNPQNVQAYYFDSQGLLRYVTTGSDLPGGDGTVAIYEWQVLPDGRRAPRSIRVTNIGDFVLIGKQTILEVEFTSVQFI